VITPGALPVEVVMPNELAQRGDGSLVPAGSWRVAVVLAVNEHGHVLQVQHPRHGWVCPSGKIELAELPLLAAYRELHEETGLVATGDLRAVKPFTHGPYHTHMFVVRGALYGTLRGEQKPDGIREARWAPASELSPLALETLARGLAAGFIV
jgi:8-oxo-dGTP pyrophosphatase MutT (NUDIX family)